MNSRLRVGIGALRHQRLARGALFIIACALAFGLEHYAESLVGDGEHRPAATQSVFNARGVYEYVVASWPRRLVPRYTALVDIDADIDPMAVSFENACAQREFLARLLPALADRGPAVIVLDKYFTASRCEAAHPSTRRLEAALADVSQRVPTIVGLKISAKPGVATASGTTAYRIHIPIAFAGAPALREALINIDPDSRRLALGWTIVRDPARAPEWRPTLALEAARAYDSQLLAKHPALADLVASRSHPYVSVIRPEAFASFLAGDILCGPGAVSPASSEGCARRQARNTDLGYLRGRIAIVGETHAEDIHFSVVGRVPGMVLQANYVEALLDERHFKPVPWWVNYGIGFLFFLGLEQALHRRSVWRTAAGIAGLFAITLLLLFLVVRHLGYYVNPVTVSAFVLAIKLIVWLTDTIVAKGGHAHGA